LKDQEQRLLSYLRQLEEQDRYSLLRFAAFLAGDQTIETTQAVAQTTQEDDTGAADIPPPQHVERPENERVVDALKRLANVYPMLDKKPLLDKASSVVAQHVMFAKPAKQAIDEIEKLFAEAYDKFVEEQGKS